MSDHLKALAERYGVALHYQNARGEIVPTDLQVVSKLLQSMRLLTENDKEDAFQQQLLPPVLVISPHDGEITIDLSKAPERDRVAWSLTLESGEVRQGSAETIQRISRDGKAFTHSLKIPSFAFGYHKLDLAETHAHTTLIVTPSQCYLPKKLGDGGRSWGISLQLYLLRSELNWGIGDFSDLAQLAEISGDWGCDVLGLNPLHLMFPDKPEHASPYSPASRNFLNVLYIDVEAIPEFQYSEASNLLASEAFKTAIVEIRASDQVNYTGVTD